MMATSRANANPVKRFFIHLITRDISLEDAILDLIDNAIDSLIRTRSIDLYLDLKSGVSPQTSNGISHTKVEYSQSKFCIKDDCGGISFESARDDVFRFGHPEHYENSSLSVFGIGMKRAIFKIGRKISIESHSHSSGFKMELDVDKWLLDDDPNWQIPIEEADPANDELLAGTQIEITNLHDEVKSSTRNPVFSTRLINAMQETYPFYLGKYIQVVVNGKEIMGKDLSFGESDRIKPAMENWQDGTVNIGLLCGLLPRLGNPWTTEKSGWYLLCNGRVIVHADKTKLTGWGSLLPQFMPKNRGFLGLVFFMSNQPEDLPWNTTKRGVNTDSAIFIRTLKKMVALARPVITFQNRIFASNDDDAPKDDYKESINDLKAASATQQAAEMADPKTYAEHSFSVKDVPEKPQKATISFKVPPEELARVKKRMGRVRMANREVGESVFRYYFEREC